MQGLSPLLIRVLREDDVAHEQDGADEEDGKTCDADDGRDDVDDVHVFFSPRDCAEEIMARRLLPCQRRSFSDPGG
jgi:hypothetical protein